MNAEVLKNLVELFQKKQFTEVLKMAGPIIGQSPNDLTALNIFSASAAFTGQFQLAENFEAWASDRFWSCRIKQQFGQRFIKARKIC